MLSPGGVGSGGALPQTPGPKCRLNFLSAMRVDVGYVGTFKEPITLATLKQTPKLEKMLVIQRGSRLSVQPVTPEEWDIVMRLGELVT